MFYVTYNPAIFHKIFLEKDQITEVDVCDFCGQWQLRYGDRVCIQTVSFLRCFLLNKKGESLQEQETIYFTNSNKNSLVYKISACCMCMANIWYKAPYTQMKNICNTKQIWISQNFEANWFSPFYSQSAIITKKKKKKKTYCETFRYAVKPPHTGKPTK